MSRQEANEKYRQTEKGRAARALAQAKWKAKQRAETQKPKSVKARRNIASDAVYDSPEVKELYEVLGDGSEQAKKRGRELLDIIAEKKKSERDAYRANPPEQVAAFGKAASRLFDDLKKSWPELEEHQESFVSDMILPLWGKYYLPSNLLSGVFAKVKQEWWKHVKHYAEACGCAIGLSEYGFGYEFDGEQHRSTNTWNDVCASCRSFAWHDTSVDMALAVTGLIHQTYDMERLRMAEEGEESGGTTVVS